MRIFHEDNASARDRFNSLAHRIKNGDAQAGEEVFRHFNSLIYRFFLARIGSRDAAEDLTQDVFVKIVGKIETFHEASGTFTAWVWQITRNTLTDHFREKRPVVFSDDLVESRASTDGEADDGTRRERLQEVMRVVRELTDEEQELFSLYHLSGVPYPELSRMTGKSQGALRVAVHRITEKVKRKFQ